jgi:hypothetical protein
VAVFVARLLRVFVPDSGDRKEVSVQRLTELFLAAPKRSLHMFHTLQVVPWGSCLAAPVLLARLAAVIEWMHTLGRRFHGV